MVHSTALPPKKDNMPIRSVTQKYSDRGSIKDIAQGITMTPNEPPTSLELRMRDLYQLATETQNKDLQRELGFIVMSEPGNKAAFPVTVFRHREYINSLSQELKDRIAKNKEVLEECFNHPSIPALRMPIYKQCNALNTILQPGEMIKNASVGASVSIKRSFRRIG